MTLPEFLKYKEHIDILESYDLAVQLDESDRQKQENPK